MNALVLALLVAGAGIRPFPAMRDPGIHAAAGATASVTIDAMPYTRTVACPGPYPTGVAYTLTGTSTGSGAVTWSASETLDSGTCTGTDTFSCELKVFPSGVGDGVNTITVTRGGATDTVEMGFYFYDQLHTCFLSQNVNGSYNSGLADLDAVTTWENVGTSALDVTQGTAAAKPTFRTGIVGGQPVVRCDGGDRLANSSTSAYIFMTDGSDWSATSVAATSSANPNALSPIVATSTGATASRGVIFAYEDRAASSKNDTALLFMSNGAATVFFTTPANDTVVSGLFHDITWWLDDDGGGGNDGFIDADGTTILSTPSTAAYASSVHTAMTICAVADGSILLNGDLFRVIIYQSALTSTQRGINKAVDEWALGGTLPVTP